MRSRVSFSYVDKYQTSYQTYADTVFFEHDRTHPRIYKDKVKYTYIGESLWTYVHHDLGTSYIHNNGSNESVVLYENEYESGDMYIQDMYSPVTRNASKLILVDSPNVPNKSMFVSPVK